MLAASAFRAAVSRFRIFGSLSFSESTRASRDVATPARWLGRLTIGSPNLVNRLPYIQATVAPFSPKSERSGP